MLAGLQRRGLDGAPLLARAGIDLAETDTRIPVERYALLYNLCVEALEDEAFGLLPEPMRPGSFEFLCRALLGAPTLGEALLRAIRFLRIVLPAFRIELRVAGARAELLIDDDGSLGPARDAPARVFAYEWLLRLLHGVASWFVARGLALDLGRGERCLVIAVVGEEAEARPRGGVAVEAPEPFVGRQCGDELACGVGDGHAVTDRGAGVVEGLDGHVGLPPGRLVCGPGLRSRLLMMADRRWGIGPRLDARRCSGLGGRG